MHPSPHGPKRNGARLSNKLVQDLAAAGCPVAKEHKRLSDFDDEHWQANKAGGEVLAKALKKLMYARGVNQGHWKEIVDLINSGNFEKLKAAMNLRVRGPEDEYF